MTSLWECLGLKEDLYRGAGLYRMSVPPGWIVQTRSDEHRRHEATRPASPTFFVPDPGHEWVAEPQPSLAMHYENEALKKKIAELQKESDAHDAVWSALEVYVRATFEGIDTYDVPSGCMVPVLPVKASLSGNDLSKLLKALAKAYPGELARAVAKTTVVSAADKPYVRISKGGRG